MGGNKIAGHVTCRHATDLKCFSLVFFLPTHAHTRPCVWFWGWADLWFLSRPGWRLWLDETESSDAESQAICQYWPWDWPQWNQGGWGIILCTRPVLHIVVVAVKWQNIWENRNKINKICYTFWTLDNKVLSCWFQATTCTLKHHGRVFRETRLVFFLHFLTWPQSRAPRAPAEFHTVCPSTITWRASILVSSTTENDAQTYTHCLLPHESIHRNTMTWHSGERADTRYYRDTRIARLLSEAELCVWPSLIELVRHNIVVVCVCAWGGCLVVIKVFFVCSCLCLTGAFVCLEVVEGGSGCVIYGSGKTQSVIWGSCSS